MRSNVKIALKSWTCAATNNVIIIHNSCQDLVTEVDHCWERMQQAINFEKYTFCIVWINEYSFLPQIGLLTNLTTGGEDFYKFITGARVAYEVYNRVSSKATVEQYEVRMTST